MSEISIYDIVPTPKLADKLIGTSVGGVIEDVTYNFTLQELLQLFIPNIPANTLQGVLDYGNTATQDINLTGTINTTDLNVLATANILDSVLTGETHVEGELFDGLDSKGTAGQVLTSTGSGVEWYTIPTVIPTLQQVLESGNTSDVSIILTANISAVTATASNVVSNTSLSVNGTLKDGTASAGGVDQILSSTGSGVRWVDMPVYNVISPLLYDTPTKTFSIQVANSSQGGYLSSADWINFDGKQDAIILTTAGTSGAATFVGNTLNIPVYTPDLSGYVPISRTLTINGVTYDLSANRTWTIPAGVADVTATSPLFSSGGAYPDISIQVANATQGGYLSSADWNTFNNKGSGTLSSVGVSMPSAFSVANSPLTANGTIAITGAGTISEYIRGDGSLAAFPALTGYVPYTGATTNVDLGEFGITSGYVGFDLTPTATPTTVGTMYWDAFYRTVSLNDGDGDTTLQIGQEERLLIHNNTGATLTDGQVVYVTGSTGELPSVSLANASSESTSAATLGVVTESIANGADGFVTVSGIVHGLNTLAYTEGDLLWLSDTAGQFTNIKPISPSHLVLIGYVIKRAGGNGSILVKIQNTQELSESSDVLISAPEIDGQGLFLQTISGVQLWRNRSISDVIGGSPITGSGTTNYVPKFTSASSIGDSNIQDSGSLITLGSNSYVNGRLAVGLTASVNTSLFVSGNITGGITSQSIYSQSTIQSDVTSSAIIFRSSPSTAAASFTLPNLFHFQTVQGTIGAGSSVTTQIGFDAGASMVGATNNWGFRGNIPAAANNWNLYMSGTANNYLAGSLGIGTTALTGYNLKVSKNITGSTIGYGVSSEGVIQSDVTATSILFRTNPSTQATTFTLSNLKHFSANLDTIGSGNTITNQYGYIVESNVIGATNNFAFYGNIASSSGRWNLYMNGTANNYIAGSLGIGNASLTGVNLKVAKTITGATTSYNITSEGVTQSDVTTTSNYYLSLASTAAASFTLTNLVHFRSQQSTIGASSVVTNQYGFFVDSTLTGATNNYGFYGNIASGSNRWNLYMSGTAANYMAGSLNIGVTTLGGTNLSLNKTITGGWVGSSTYGVNMYSTGAVQSDVTAFAYYFVTRPSTAATTFTVSTINSFAASNVSVGAGSTIGTLHGFNVEATHIGATNNYAFRGQLASAANTWNLYMSGTANNYLAGSLGIGALNLSGINLFVSKTLTGSVDSYHVNVNGIIQSDVTSSATYFRSSGSTAAASFTLGSLYHYVANQGAIGAGSSIGSQFGFRVESTLIGATNNFGFFGDLASGTNIWNLYMNGTANNYLAGALAIGATNFTGSSLRVGKNITGVVTSYGILADGSVDSDVTTALNYASVSKTSAASFTLPTYNHFYAIQGTFGAGSTVTTQQGFVATSTLIGATTNIGFRGDIPAGTNRWNLYMGGTAINYMSGALLIGTTTDAGYKLDVVGSTNVSSSNYHRYNGDTGLFGSGSAINGGTVSQLGIRAANDILFATNGANERMRLSSTGSLGVGATSINASAKVQIDSTTQGFLPPRMTAAQRAAIASPAEGLVVVQTNGTQGLYLYIGAAWHSLTML